MSMSGLKKTWDRLGRVDPMFAIMTCPGTKWTLSEFFQTGEYEVSELFQKLRALSLYPKGIAVDFGCGIGRVTQALVPHFTRVIGVDIAQSMVEQAKRYNRHGSRCEYVVNSTDRLPECWQGSVNFLYSNITLQHMHPLLAERYIRDFPRVLSSGGVLVFQLPGEIRVGMVRRIARAVVPRGVRRCLRTIRGGLDYEMYGRSKEEVINLLRHVGLTIKDVTQNHSAGPDWSSYLYCAVK